jgi:hypothetical protein
LHFTGIQRPPSGALLACFQNQNAPFINARVAQQRIAVCCQYDLSLCFSVALQAVHDERNFFHDGVVERNFRFLQQQHGTALQQRP